MIFDIAEIPEMKRGQGVILQRFKDAKLTDVKVFNSAEGLSWQQNGGRVRVEQDITPWFAKRGGAGKIPPVGFPRDNRF